MVVYFLCVKGASSRPHRLNQPQVRLFWTVGYIGDNVRDCGKPASRGVDLIEGWGTVPHIGKSTSKTPQVPLTDGGRLLAVSIDCRRTLVVSALESSGYFLRP